jgi:hypothetical protein
MPWPDRSGSPLELRCTNDAAAGASEFICVTGIDEFVYKQRVRADGALERSWFVDGVYEYKRIIEAPGKQRVVLIRCLRDTWAKESSEPPPLGSASDKCP